MTEFTQATPELGLPLHPRGELECRRCEIHCDKVVHPSACLDRSCPFVYAYNAFGRRYMGCMQKIFSVEIDLDLLEEASGRPGGFGAIRAEREPLPMCRLEVSSCYPHHADALGCRNPEFFETVQSRRTFRVFAQPDSRSS